MAYYRRRRIYCKRPATKRNTIRKAFNKKRNTNITRVVKKVLAHTAETKVLQTSGSLSVKNINTNTTQAQFDGAYFIPTPQGAINLSIGAGYPLLVNGVAQDQRIGDEVKVKGTYINYIAYPKPYDATFNPTPAPQILMMFLLKPKIGNANGFGIDQFKIGNSATLFENMSNTDSGLNGGLTDLIRKIDKDNYQILAMKQHKLGFAGNLNTSNQLSTLPNNDFKAFVRGRFKIPSYNLKFSRTDFPQTMNTILFCTTIRADGTTQASSLIPCQVDYNCSVYFTDM